MSKFEEMSSYVRDKSRFAVCGEMSIKIAEADTDTKDKLAFESVEMALSKAKEVGVLDQQVPYLCQFCQFWHLGSNTNIGAEERVFYIPKRISYLTRGEVKQGRPLYDHVSSFKMENHNTPTNEIFKLERIVKQNNLPRLNLYKLQEFRISPQYRAVVWALHMPSKRQPVFLKTDNDIIFRSRAGDYWV